jgi:HD-like signal output (HDOD) protein
MKTLERLERIRALAWDPRLRLEDLEGCIAQEPGLAAEVVRIADSALCGMPGRIHTLSRALLILGAREVCAIAALVLVRRELRGEAGDGRWLHSLEVALASQLVAQRLGLGLESEAFLAGLLHELRETPRAGPALAALLCAAHALLAGAPADARVELDLYADDQAAVRAGVAARLERLTEVV